MQAYEEMRTSAEKHHVEYSDCYCLAQISNFNKLIALSNAQSIPVFELKPDKAMFSDGQARTLAWFKFLYEALAKRVLRLSSDEH